MRASRIMLIFLLSATVMMAAALFNLLAGSGPPKRLVPASVITGASLAVSLGANLLVYRVRAGRERSSGLAQSTSFAVSGFAPSGLDPRTILRVVRVMLVATAAITGLILMAGFGHGIWLRASTTPMPGWPRASATVVRVDLEWTGSSYTYAPVAEFTALGHAVYFTAPVASDVAVNVGDQIQIIYQPGNPYLLHDLSVGQNAWKYPVYTSLSALAFVLLALVTGLALTDPERLARRSGISLGAQP